MTRKLVESATYAFVASLTAVALMGMTYFMVEPAITHGQEATSNEFTIQQTITDENSFQVVGDVVMNGPINGVTGGNATGTTQFVVLSNNSAGYTVEIDFEYGVGQNEAMVGDESGSEAIRDYGGDAAGPEPSANFTASSAAQFAYTVVASSSTHVDPSFLSSGGLCNVGLGSQEPDTCWKAPQDTGYQIIDTSVATPQGATSTLQFKVNVPNAATPTPLAETYTATATLSLFTK